MSSLLRATVCCMQVKCCECGYESNTVDDFLHISLEITRASSLTKALQRFTSGEYLDQENKYKCPKQVLRHLPWHSGHHRCLWALDLCCARPRPCVAASEVMSAITYQLGGLT